ncbi:hypothetical protein EJB05_11912, partial [Eragrostis curvula]
MARGRRRERHRHHPRPPGRDRISDLPDELLLAILARLRSTRDAARTSILSRRWRRVWAHLPALSFLWEGVAIPAQEVDRVDAALHARAAAGFTFNLLEIKADRVFADRVVPWLRFASQHLTGKLCLSLVISRQSLETPEIEFPLCERFTSIRLDLCFRIRLLFKLSPSAGGAFTALATMMITWAHVDGQELDAVLSARCPNLKELTLEYITAVGDLLIRSDSLEKLKIKTDKLLEGRLKATTPKLLTLEASITCDAWIAAPLLSEVDWCVEPYDRSRHFITEAAHHLRQLTIMTHPSNTGDLMQRFDTVDMLNLLINVQMGKEEYNIFLDDINQLSQCDVLKIRLYIRGHAFRPTMLHLLRKCIGVRKLVVDYSGFIQSDNCCMSRGCSCKWPDKMEKIVLNALEEIEVKGHGTADCKVELVRLLCNGNVTSQKKMTITVLEDIRQIGYIRKEIGHCIILPNDKVEVIVKSASVEI